MTRKASSPDPLRLHREVRDLADAVLVLAKRVVKLEKAQAKRSPAIGFSTCVESGNYIYSAEDVETIESEGNVVS